MFLYFWKNPNRTDQESISFNSFQELSDKLSEKNIILHDPKKLEREIRVGPYKSFYAFFSNLNGKDGLEYYTNLNFALKAQKEYSSHLKRFAKR